MSDHPSRYCWYCGVELRRNRTKTPDAHTLDHVQPLSRGGFRKQNLVPACFACNQDKGNMTLAEYREATGVRFFWGERFNPKRVKWTATRPPNYDSFHRWLKEVKPWALS